MLKILRKKGISKKILWILAVVIIISFGFLGTAYLFNDISLNDAGKIFGRRISRNQFLESYLHTRNQAILRYGEEFFKIEPYLNLDQETWDRLILLHEAKRRRIKVSDEEVIRTIAQYPFFERNNRFDKLLYHDILRNVFRCKPRDFEEGVRETIAFSKLYGQQTSGVMASDEELWEEYKKRNAKVQVSYLLFSPEDFKNESSVSDEEIRKYYEEHKTVFLMPDTINVEYISLAYPEDASTEQKSEAESKTHLIQQELKANPDLKSVGEKYGVDVQESGLFSHEQPNLKIGWSYELLQKAFELEKNELSDPIETPQGYYILKVKEKNPAHIAEFPEIQEKIKETILLKKAREIARTKAQKSLKALKEASLSNPKKAFEQIGESLNIPIQQTPLFHKGEYLPTIGLSKEFQDAAFGLEEQDKISPIVETTKGFCILRSDLVQSVSREDFEKEKPAFAQSLLDEKRNQTFNEFMAILRIKANLQDNISRLKSTP